MFVAAALVGLVYDPGDRVPEAAVILGDEHEPFLLPESAQPVPSSGLPGRR
jgi:hypothetical protein